MERNRDLRRVSMAVINGVPRRRHKITRIRDSHEDGQMKLEETVYIDKEREQKKNRVLEGSKRRRVERDGVQHRRAGGSNREVETGDGDADDSWEEDFEEEDNGRIRRLNRMDRMGPSSNNQSQRLSLRTLRSSPALRISDEIIGVPIPRRTRSASSKRLHEYCNSGSGGSREDLSHRRLSPSNSSPTGGDIVAPSSLGVCLKEKMFSFSHSSSPQTCEPKSSSNSKHSSLIQNDIEIEVAEALFDLLKQSQSQPSKKQEQLDSDSKITAGDRCIYSPIVPKSSPTSDLSQDFCSSFTTLVDDGLNREKAGDDDFHNQSDQLMEVDTKTIMVDPLESKKEKLPSNTAAQNSICEGIVNKEEKVDRKESASPCAKGNVDEPMDSSGTKAKSTSMEDDTIRETKFTIDLMKSEIREQEDLSAVIMQPEEEKMGIIGIKQESANLETEKPYPDISSSSGPNKPQQQGGKEQKTQLQSSSLPFPIATSSWPGVLPHSGLVLSLQTVNPINGSTRSSTAFQLPPFDLSQPRSKRCTTHQYIAQNIRYHQQLGENALWSGAAAPTLCGAKTLNLNSMQPTEELILGNPSQADFFPGAQKSTTKGANGKDKSSEAAASLDNVKSRKHVLQQSSQQVPAGNLLHGPAFIFPLGHCQAATNNHSGPPQSDSIIGNTSLSTNLAAGLPVVSFNYSKFPSNKAPPFSSNNIEMPRGTQAPVVPFLNSYYSLSPFSFPQTRPQLSHSHILVQSAPQDTSTSNDASSHKLQHGDQRTGIKISSTSFPMPIVHSEQPEKQQHLPSHSSSKSDTDISRISAAVTDSLVSQSLNTNSGPNFLSPIPSTNFALIPPGKFSGGAIGNKHGDPQKQGSNGRVDIIPQAFSLSFGSNASTTPEINFSSMAQNFAIFQMLPDMARNGYQMVPAAKMVKQLKNSQMPERKTIPGSNNTDDGQKVRLGKPPTSGVQSLTGTSVFDGSARTVNFLPIPVAGNQLFPSSSSAITSFVSVNTLNSRQHQQLAHQQMQLSGTAHIKEPTCVPASSVTSSVPNNNCVYSQISVHQNNSSVSTQWQNFPRTLVPGISSASATSSLVNIPQ